MIQATHNFLVGLVSLVAIVGLAYLLMRFGELDQFLSPRYELTIYTNHAAGLRPGSLTEYNGVPIGVVDAIRVDPDAGKDPEYGVRVRVLIEHGIQIPSDVVPYSKTSLFGGSAVLELEHDTSDGNQAAAYFKSDGTAEIRSPIRESMIERLTAELDKRMAPIVDALDSFSRLSETYTTFGENLNELIAPDAETGEPLDLHKTILNLNDVLAQVDEALKLAKEWLGDDQLRTDIKVAVENANSLIHRAADTLDRYTRLADELQVNAETVVNGLLPITDDISVTLEEVRRLTKLATEGEGTVAQLLKNPDLYNSIDDAAIRLERTLVEIQLYIAKIKAEGLNVDF